MFLAEEEYVQSWGMGVAQYGCSGLADGQAVEMRLQRERQGLGFEGPAYCGS